MHRRRFLTFASVSAGWLVLSGHSPYRQWVVYRDTHLVVVTSRDDPGADELGEKCVAVMREALPDSKAAVGRGPRVQRIASLMSTRQADVGVVSRANALAMYRGTAPFEQYGSIPLRVLVQTTDYMLVCREDFLLQHAYLVAEALMKHGKDLGLTVPGREAAEVGQIPPHAGALAFVEGRPLDARVRQ